LIVSQLGYQLRLASRTPRSLLAGVLLPALILLMRDPSDRGTSTLLAGLVALGSISTAYVAHANSLVIARESGVLRRWRTSPLPAYCYFAGKALATMLLAVASAAVTVLIAGCLGRGVDLGSAAFLLVPITVGALVWASLGTAVSAFIPTAEAAYPLLTVTSLPIVLLSGAVGSASAPSWLTTLLGYLPARPVIDAAAHALRHPGDWQLCSVRDVAVVLTWALAGVIVVRYRFRWTPSRPTR
jgi:ABC-2 type transport system permease protein